MSSSHLAIIGAGGHARSVGSIAIEGLGLRPTCFYDLADGPIPASPALSEANKIFGLPVVALGAHRVSFLRAQGVEAIVLAVGDNLKRDALFAELSPHFEFPNLISPTAQVKKTCVFGKGNVVLDLAYLGPDTRIGNNNIINTRALIEHECEIGNSNHVAPGATLLGRVKIGSLSFIGAGAVVKQGISLGDSITLGAQAFAHESLGAGIFYGIPASKGKKK